MILKTLDKNWASLHTFKLSLIIENVSLFVTRIKKNDKALYTLGISLKIKSHFTILQMSNKMVLHFAFFIGTIKNSKTLRL